MSKAMRTQPEMIPDPWCFSPKLKSHFWHFRLWCSQQSKSGREFVLLLRRDFAQKQKLLTFCANSSSNGKNKTQPIALEWARPNSDGCSKFLNFENKAGKKGGVQRTQRGVGGIRVQTCIPSETCARANFVKHLEVLANLRRLQIIRAKKQHSQYLRVRNPTNKRSRNGHCTALSAYNSFRKKTNCREKRRKRKFPPVIVSVDLL